MELDLTKKEIEEIKKEEQHWGDKEKRSQEEINYVIRVRLFEKNFDRIQGKVKEELDKAKLIQDQLKPDHKTYGINYRDGFIRQNRDQNRRRDNNNRKNRNNNNRANRNQEETKQ